MVKKFPAVALASALVVSLETASAVAAPDDGFAAFWREFAAAAAKDDQAALARMVVLSIELEQVTPLTFAKFHHDLLGPKVRKCLAKAKPVRAIDGEGQVNYSAFCGEMIYVFDRTGGAWKLTATSPND